MRTTIFFLTLLCSFTVFAYPTCDGIVATEAEREQQTHELETRGQWPRPRQNAYIRNLEAHLKPGEHWQWDLLNDEERMGITLYTMATFGDLNRQLRADELVIVNTFRILCSALNKLPNYEGKVVRILDMTAENFAQLKRTGTYFDAGFMSTSQSLVLIWEKNTVLNIHSHYGKNIMPFSSHKNEKEVLMYPSSHFKVIEAIEHRAPEVFRFQYEIELEEI